MKLQRLLARRGHQRRRSLAVLTQPQGPVFLFEDHRDSMVNSPNGGIGGGGYYRGRYWRFRPVPYTESKISVTGGAMQIGIAVAPLDVCVSSRHSQAMLIYKIMTAGQWDELDRTGSFVGAPIDLTDGYIHTSTAGQAQETADKHFAGQKGLMLVALEAATYGDDLVWEVSRGGAKFPHIYHRPLLRSEIVWARAIPLIDGRHVLDLL